MGCNQCKMKRGQPNMKRNTSEFKIEIEPPSVKHEKAVIAKLNDNPDDFFISPNIKACFKEEQSKLPYGLNSRIKTPVFDSLKFIENASQEPRLVKAQKE